MGIGLNEADQLSLYEYEEILHHNNEAYDTDEPGAPPDKERARLSIDRINADPLLTH